MDTPESPKTHTDNDLQPDAKSPDRGKPAQTVAQSSKIPHTKKRGRPKIDYPATLEPTIGDIREVAGFYEGEGHFRVVDKKLEVVQIGQNDKEKLIWIQARFGGKIYGPYSNSVGNDIYYLKIVRERALGFMFTIFTFLSASRRQQFRQALEGKDSSRNYQATFDEDSSLPYIKRKLEALIKKANKKRRGPLSLFGVGK